MKKILVYMKDYKKESILGPLFKLLEASFELLIPLVVAQIIDIGIPQKESSYIIKMCLIMAGLGAIGLICSITAQFYAAKAAVGFSTKLRHALFSHIQGLSFSKMDEIGTSTLITRMTSDINQVQTGVNLVLRLFLRSPFIVFGAMIMAFTVDAKSAIIFVVTIPLLSIIVFGIMLISIPLFKKVQTALDTVLGVTRENLIGARVIRAFGQEETEIEKFSYSTAILQKIQIFTGRLSALMNPLTYIVVNFGIIAILYQGSAQVQTGTLTQGQVVALVNYMSQILVELIKLANLIITVTKAAASAHRIETILELEQGLDATPYHTNQSEKNGEHPNHPTKVAFEHVSMRYHENGEEALSDIHFTAQAGEIIGVIGGTGSGKSTLVNLIPRFYDITEGRLSIDGTDVRNYDLQELRTKTAIVMQKAVLFKGSIRENLLWGNAYADDKALWRALETACAEEFVKDKEGQLDAPIEQEGRNLSGGQRQRLSIARALVKEPEILILDDSASALDYATEARLRANIRRFSKETTVFIVSQRASSLMYADQIIVLEDGKAAAIGKHEELLESCFIYREIYSSQFERG